MKKKVDELSALIDRFLEWYKRPHTDDEITAGKRKLISTIQQIFASSGRNPEHLRKYWAWINWASENAPQTILDQFGVSHISPDLLHNLLKIKFETESISFAKMTEEEFNVYHGKAAAWVAQYFFSCDRETMEQEFDLHG